MTCLAAIAGLAACRRPIDADAPKAASPHQHATASSPLASTASPRLVFSRGTQERHHQTVPKTFIENGQRSNDFPAVFFVNTGDFSCSATLIGRSVVLTAGHCLEHAQERIRLRHPSGASYTGTCDRAPGYREIDDDIGEQQPLNDWALCKMDAAPPDIPAEVVNTDPARVTVGTELEVTGWGCDLTQGILSVGDVFEVGFMRVSEPSIDHTDRILLTALNGTILCPGDSGGATFANVTDTQGKERVEVGVNSWTRTNGFSIVSSLASPDAQEFLFTWSACRGETICGIDADDGHCRTPNVPRGNVPRPTTPAVCKAIWQSGTGE
jgi:hypothetical protein